MIQQRNCFLDEVKGIAILAVVLFHLGLFKWGYLGVDVFYVIAGYVWNRRYAKCMLTPGGRMLAFSDERKMISHDCYHLTRGGARFLAKRLDSVLKEIIR